MLAGRQVGGAGPEVEQGTARHYVAQYGTSLSYVCVCVCVCAFRPPYSNTGYIYE